MVNNGGRQLEFFSTGLDRGAGPDFPSTGYLLRKYSDEAVKYSSGKMDSEDMDIFPAWRTLFELC